MLCRYSESRYAECRYAECRYAECLSAQQSVTKVKAMIDINSVTYKDAPEAAAKQELLFNKPTSEAGSGFDEHLSLT